MSDRVVDIDNLRPKNDGVKKKVVTVISVLVLIALVVFIFFQTDLRFLFNKQAEEILMSQNSIASYPISSTSYVLNEKYRNGVVVCADSSVYALDEGLKTLWEKEINAAAPVMEVSGDCVLIADNGGRNYYLFDRDNTIIENQAERVITGASVSPDGKHVLICEDSPYLGAVMLYSDKGELMYEWHSGDGYIIDALYIPESKMLAVMTLEVGETVQSGVLFFDIYNSEPAFSYTYDDVVAVNLFSGGGSVYAVCDDKTYGYELTGGEKFSYDYSGRTVEKCEFDTSGKLALVFDSGSKSDIVILDSKGQEEGEIRVNESVNYISIDSGKIAVNGGGGIYIYNLSGRWLYDVITDRDVKDVCLLNGATRFFGISSVSFDTVKIQ